MELIMKKQLGIMIPAAFLLLCTNAGAAVLNEWSFEVDPSGRTLGQATNSGSIGTAVFSGADPVTQTDGAGGLACSYVAGAGGLWTDGAVLRANAAPSTPGETRYLRYDVDYDMTSPSIDSGTLISLAFSDGVSSDLAGFALQYRVTTPSLPAGVNLTPVKQNLSLSGTISVIAELNMADGTLRAWYDLSGDADFDYDSPDATVSNLTLSAISELEFRATGDFIAGSSECAVVDEIRTATSWDEISGPPADYSLPPVPQVLQFTDQLGGGMLAGQTNTLQVVIKNTVSPAASVSSILSFDGAPGAFTIISENNPVALGANRITTNTYQVIAHIDGQYQFEAKAVSDGMESDPKALVILVGRRITGGLESINDAGAGVVDGRPEPGEVFELVIASTNTGAIVVNDITNSLTALNPSYFPEIVPTNATVYASLDLGEVAVTTYRVTASEDVPAGLQTFAIINRSAEGSWTNYVEVDVFRESMLQITNELTIAAFPGQPVSGTAELFNIGNVGTAFAVSDDGAFVTSYSESVQSVRRVSLSGAETLFPEWDGTNSTPMDIGFVFPLFGVEYQQFSASQEGFLTLISTNGATAQVIPFRSGELVDQMTVRYELGDERLVVAWGNTFRDDSDTLEFQAVLNVDGSVLYLYEYESSTGAPWGSGEIGLSGPDNEQSFSHVPGGSSKDALLLTPESWVSFSPDNGYLPDFGSNEDLTFTVTPPLAAIGSNTTTITVVGDDNTVTLEVTVIVEPELLRLDVPGVFSFRGPAGVISPAANLMVSNSGNGTVSFVVSDSGQAAAGHISDFIDYQWHHIPDGIGVVLDETMGDPVEVDIGFPYQFNGTIYTNLLVDERGITLGTNSLVPFVADLSLDNNASVRVLRDGSLSRLVVTWENMALNGGGEDQSFQAVLYRDGSRSYNYKRLTDVQSLIYSELLTTQVVYTVGSDTFIAEEGTFSFEGETNRVTELSQVSIETVPVVPQVIRFSPYAGTLEPNETTNIVLRGDARSLTAGGTTNAVVETTLTFSYADTNAQSFVTFTATNSVESAFAEPVVRSAMWGTDRPVVSSALSTDGSRTLSWPAPNDDLSRAYTVWFTTSLSRSWEFLGRVENATSFVDDVHVDEPVIFYRVTVE